MNVAYTERVTVSYDDPAPLIIAASSADANQRARLLLDQWGVRIGAELPIEEMSERLRQQAAASAVWVEVDADSGGALDALLHQVSADVAAGRYAAVVSTTRNVIDHVVAGLGDSAVEVIVDADDAERAAALAVATSATAKPLRLSDVAADRSAEQLRQLSEEVNRIATMLARLSAGPDTTPRAILPTEGDVPPVSIDTVRKVIRARRLRTRFFREELFADPAWDMLLDLLQAELAQLRVPVSSLCIAAAVPATTALRWLKTMVAEGIFVRRSDPHDGRRVFVELGPDTRNAMHRYFAEVERVAVI
ncbi:MAG: MarR family winged helix-turn-helix transcriptional regulator [Sphingomicrobium sp.]